MKTEGGSISGRQMRSPLPVHSARPSLSWISGRQSAAYCAHFRRYQYMLVSGAMPSRAISVRKKQLRMAFSVIEPVVSLATNR